MRHRSRIHTASSSLFCRFQPSFFSGRQNGVCERGHTAGWGYPPREVGRFDRSRHLRSIGGAVGVLMACPPNGRTVVRRRTRRPAPRRFGPGPSTGDYAVSSGGLDPAHFARYRVANAEISTAQRCTHETSYAAGATTAVMFVSLSPGPGLIVGRCYAERVPRNCHARTRGSGQMVSGRSTSAWW